MAQTTKGMRGILSHPLLYTAFQNLMGAKRIRRRFVRDFVLPEKGYNILDIGCGPADILSNLPKVNYWGMDVSQAYIKQAKERYGSRGYFLCQTINKTSLSEFPRFDIVMGLGVLHHLDDAEVEELLSLVQQALRPGGRFVSFDPCLVEGQSPIARYLITHDRGMNVRQEEQYKRLVSPWFKHVRGEIKHQLWVPYTHYMMACHKS